MSEYITVDTAAGTFKAYMAVPTKLPAPAIVVVQEIFGVNKDLRATCDELASQGYLAVSPDLVWSRESDLDMNALDEADWKKGFELYTAFNLNTGVDDIAATMTKAASLPGCTGKVGLMGYCLGGLMTYLTTARKGTVASVAYYPGSTEKHLEEAGKIKSPLIIHLGEEDEYISKDAQRAIKEALKDNPKVTVYSYSGQSHAFARHNGTHYDKPSADLANGRTADFFREHLG
jgi:carboxymethylenebutenolidase